MDSRRELEFTLIMLNEQQVRSQQRGQANIAEMEHKIEVLRLNHSKI